MAAVVGITLVKKMTYRTDDTEEFSNQYWLTGAIPSSGAAWTTLIDALIAQEKTCYPNTVFVVRGYAYDSDADNAASVYLRDLTLAPVAGTCTQVTSVTAPGDTAVWVRWRTSRNNTKGKPIFLRKYFHGAMFVNGAGAPDQIAAGQRTALTAFGAKMRDGSFAEARTLRSRLHDETLTAHDACLYLTTRTLKRRGKRPGS